MNDDETIEILLSLPSSEGYSAKDRYHDFRRVFTGSEEGKRVFREILAWGRMFRPSALNTPVDPYLTHIREGERNIALKLLHVVNNEPPELKSKTQHKR